MRITVLIFVFCVGYPATMLSQTNEFEYHRSSLYTILMESDSFPGKDTVINAYYKAPFPDKYNNHNLKAKSFDPKKYQMDYSEPQSTNFYDNISQKYYVANDPQPYWGLSSNQYLKENEVAKKLVAKWFNRKEDGSFDMKMISERGMYDAKELEASIAHYSIRGTAMLSDAGEELIQNTFVIVSKMNFVENEKTALALKKSLKIASYGIPSIIGQIAVRKAVNIAYKKMKEGYSVWTTSRLYHLKWNDSIAAVFYRDYWMDQSNIDSARKAAFDESNMFVLVFVGEQKSTSLVTQTFIKSRSEEELITIATIRNIDKVYLKLQKNYDIFKTKTPLNIGFPLSADIGYKEGLSGKEKFEVIEMVMDENTGRTVYKRKGVIKVNKKKICDNRYNESEQTPSQSSDATYFKGGKKSYEGLLIRQIK